MGEGRGRGIYIIFVNYFCFYKLYYTFSYDNCIFKINFIYFDRGDKIPADLIYFYEENKEQEDQDVKNEVQDVYNKVAKKV